MESSVEKAAAAPAAMGGGGCGCGGWETPKRVEYRIPATLPCPAAPRKAVPDFRKRRSPPKNGYFQPPDLEALFALAPPGLLLRVSAPRGGADKGSVLD